MGRRFRIVNESELALRVSVGRGQRVAETVAIGRRRIALRRAPSDLETHTSLTRPLGHAGITHNMKPNK